MLLTRIVHRMSPGLAVAGAAALIVACGSGSAKLSPTSTASVEAMQTRPASATPYESTPHAATSTPESDDPTAPAPMVSSATPELASATETPTPEPAEASATPAPTPIRWLDGGKWHYSPSGSTCVYTESKRSEALYRNFTNAEVILMDSENCSGTWYVYYPSTGEAYGGFSDPDNPRLRLRLIDQKVTVVAGTDGCTWTEARRQADGQSPGGVIVALETTCDEYDYMIWYFSETGDLRYVIA